MELTTFEVSLNIRIFTLSYSYTLRGLDKLDSVSAILSQGGPFP